MIVNDFVKFAEPESLEEAKLIYQVIEDNGNRVAVKLVTDLGLAFPVIATYLKVDLVKLEN